MAKIQAKASKFSATQFALIIGVDRLPGNWLPELGTPSRDASAIASALANIEGCAIPRSQIYLRTNHDCSSAVILQLLSEIEAKLTHNSNLVIYFAGHGVDNGEDFFLLTADANPERLSETSISGKAIENIFGQSEANGIFFTVDCCEGGAAANYAPKTFRHLRSGAYRILLASTRPGQKSWEKTDGSGTLFSNELRKILTGEIPVSNGNGAIYFSDFVQKLDESIEESRLLYSPGLPRQEMVFSGAYTKDPLLFVHRGLSLSAIEFNTARFSPKVIRRRIWQTLVGVAGVLFFTLSALYGIVDSSQYADLEGDSIVIFQGLPEFNIPGYPKRLWTLDYGPERLNGVQLPIVVNFGEKVVDQLRSHFRPIYRAVQYFDQGELSQARQLFLSIIQGVDSTPGDKFYAQLLFPTVAIEEDYPRLWELLQHERREIQIAAYRALLRMGDKPEDILDPEFGPDAAGHQDIVLRLSGECNDVFDLYLQDRFQSESNVPTNTEIIDAAIRLKCALSIDSLTRGALRPGFNGDEDIANFAILTNQSRELATNLLHHLLTSDNKSWTASTIFGTLAHLDNSPCPINTVAILPPLLLIGDVTLRAALVKHCAGIDWQISWVEEAGGFNITMKGAPASLKMLMIDPSTIEGQLGIRFLLKTRSISDTTELKQAISQMLLLPRSDDFVRAALLQTAVSYRIMIDLPDDLLDSNNLDVRRAVAEYERTLDENAFTDRIIARIGDQDEFYVELAGRAKLNPRQLEDIATLLDKSVQERRQAACILAMQAPADTVINLMSDPDTIIRESAIECATYNSEAPIILERFDGRVNDYAISGWPSFVRQLKLRKKMQGEFSDLPKSLVEWRLSLIDLTPGGFGLWHKGNRMWFREQRYQASISN